MSFKIFLFLALVDILFSEAEWFVQFGRGHYVEHFCEIILNFGQWLRRCCLKEFLFLALVAILFSGVEKFVLFW